MPKIVTIPEPKIKITEKQKQFGIEYIVDYNGTQAAIRSGYSNKGESTARTIATQNLAKLSVKSWIAQLEDVNKVKTGPIITRELVLKGLKDVFDKCNGDKEFNDDIIINNQVIPRKVKQFNAAGANSALDKMGKYTKLWDGEGAEAKVTVNVLQQIFNNAEI